MSLSLFGSFIGAVGSGMNEGRSGDLYEALGFFGSRVTLGPLSRLGRTWLDFSGLRGRLERDPLARS